MAAQKWTAQQRRVIASPGVTLDGVDARGRPVVTKPGMWSGRPMTWAVTRDGEPIDVTDPITPVEGGTP